MEHASPHVSSPPVADKASHGRSPSGTHHASGELSSCKRTSVPRDWMHTGGGGLGRCQSPVDRSSRDPVYGLPPRSTKRAFSWRPLTQHSGEGEKRDRRAYTCKYACAHVFVVNSPFPAVPPARRGCTQHSTSRAANKEAHTPLGLLLRVIPPTNPRPQGQGAAAACAASPHSGIFHPSRIPPLK